MKFKILLSLLFCLSLTSNLIAQATVFPGDNAMCPGVNVTFTITLPGIGLVSIDVEPIAFNVAPIVVSDATNQTVHNGNYTTVTFVGKFIDDNNSQTFRVYWAGGGNYYQTDFTYTHIKSLKYTQPGSTVTAFSTPLTISAPRCQVTSNAITFDKVKYVNASNNTNVYSEIDNYEYLLPANWSIGPTTSNGTDWIQDDNSVIVTSDFGTGANDFVKIRPINTACGAGLSKGTITNLTISRPEPVFSFSPINGYICSTNGTISLTINGMPSGSTVVWASADDNEALVTSGVYTPTAEITKTGSSNRMVDITATVTHCSYVYNVVYSLQLGIGTNSINWTQKNAVCEGSRPYFFGAVQAFPNSLNYEWYARDDSSPGNSFDLNQSSNENTADFPLGFYGDRYFTVRVVATNACGTVQSIDEEGSVYGPDCSGGDFGGNSIHNLQTLKAQPILQKTSGKIELKVSPNPVISNVSITLTSDQILKSTSETYEIQEITISNMLGIVQMKKSFSKDNKTVNMNVSTLRPGVYIVNVRNGKAWITSKIIKK